MRAPWRVWATRIAARDGASECCPKCQLNFHPRLMGGECPVCSWRPEVAADGGNTGFVDRLADAEMRPVLIVAVATLANLGLWLGLYLGFARH